MLSPCCFTLRARGKRVEGIGMEAAVQELVALGDASKEDIPCARHVAVFSGSVSRATTRRSETLLKSSCLRFCHITLPYRSRGTQNSYPIVQEKREIIMDAVFRAHICRQGRSRFPPPVRPTRLPRSYRACASCHVVNQKKPFQSAVSISFAATSPCIVCIGSSEYEHRIHFFTTTTFLYATVGVL